MWNLKLEISFSYKILKRFLLCWARVETWKFWNPSVYAGHHHHHHCSFVQLLLIITFFLILIRFHCSLSCFCFFSYGFVEIFSKNRFLVLKDWNSSSVISVLLLCFSFGYLKFFLQNDCGGSKVVGERMPLKEWRNLEFVRADTCVF